MLGQCLRCVRGVEVNDETLSVASIADVCTNGPGHFLGHEQTLALMETEYIYPVIGDRTSPKEWVEKGRPDIIATAIAAKNRILAQPAPDHISAALDAAIRRRFPIRL